MRDMKFGRKRKRKAPRIALALLMVAVLLAAVFLLADRRLLPPALEITYIHMQAKVNRLLQTALQEAVLSQAFVSADFYNKTVDASGLVCDLSVNTVLIGAICAELAVRLSDGLAAGGHETVEIPVGVLLGLRAFSDFGPRYAVSIHPLGGARVDYETSFRAVGINQVNFQVWLQAEISVRIVVPLQSRVVTMTRRVPLVNTVFAGRVPEIAWPMPGVTPD